MADALLSVVLDRLFSLAQQQVHDHVSLAVGAEEEIEILTNTLQIVRAVVADADKREVKEELVRIWLERLKDIAYQMDDVLDKWSTALLKSQIGRVESSSKPHKTKGEFLLKHGRPSSGVERAAAAAFNQHPSPSNYVGSASGRTSGAITDL